MRRTVTVVTVLACALVASAQEAPRPRPPTTMEAWTAAVRPPRQCAEQIGKIGTPSLRGTMERHLRELISRSTAPTDPAWARLERCAVLAVGDGSELTLDTFRASVVALAGAFPDHVRPDALLSEFEPFERTWAEVSAAVDELDEGGLKKLRELQAENRRRRDALLRSLPALDSFLIKWKSLDLPAEWARQSEVLRHDLRARKHFARVAQETFRPESLILPADRDTAEVAFRRTLALAGELKQTEGHRDEFDMLRGALAAVPVDLPDARFVLYALVAKTRREIALANPLLEFDRLLFVKRHRALYEHMCDQFYGMAQRPGGGLFVLEKPFSPDAAARDLLEHSVVTNGRLKGQKLSAVPDRKWNLSFDGMGNLKGDDTVGGSFLSPDLSYDGKSILFAYVECAGDKEHRHHADPTRGHWAEGRCYHVFKVNADGSELRMLTDGTWNDFDPVFLPNGRIAFVSERRGGYLRCGRVCPTYTLYDMAADGSDLSMLSPHETNEWNPSVTHDGRIVYTRWDYVDRHGVTAHQPWLTTLDGRDPRSVHGNFSPRPSRPDMELDLRAVPNSRKFVATAAPHHGQAFGSLVLVDPDLDDADPMGPIKRVTPDVGFPESQTGGEAYGTPWPLSEDFYLCVYDADRAMGKKGADNYGLYLVDSFGNKELLYRDAEIACQSPIPFRPRPTPPSPPAMGELARNAPGTQQAGQLSESQTGTLVVVNVYDTLEPWPADTKVTALRVLQVLPMTVPSGKPPHETGHRIDLATDSVVPVRHVLGTVPVEADGSAHFIVPADKELFFQALDERGLAVQSMRSATHLRAGERLVCQGCHESRHRAPALATKTPLALQRGPSVLKQDVDGSKPFSYPRLVQPVLDRHCVECHRENPRSPNLAREPVEKKFYASYRSLVPKFAFTSYGNNYTTTPGKFGARASGLFKLLDEGHYDVKLPPEDLHRLTLWLDCSSMFYGVYEKEGGEAQLRGEDAYPTLE